MTDPTTTPSNEVRDGDTVYHFYILAEDVKNPQGDKRHKYDWEMQPVLGRGRRFVIVTRPPVAYEIAGRQFGEPVRTLKIIRPDGQFRGGLYPHQPLFPVIEPYLIPANPKVTEIIKGVYSGCYEELVEGLIRSGQLTVAQVVEAMRKIDSAEEEK